MRKLRILYLTHEDYVPPDDVKGLSEEARDKFKTDYDVIRGLRKLGHEVRVLGVVDDLGKIRSAVDEFKPHLAFNLLEEFHGTALYDQHVVSYLELLRTPYTGCSPRGLTIARDKGLSKMILAYHRVPIPKFAVFLMGAKIKRPAKLEFPLIVKSLTEHASLGISQASVVTNDQKLKERVELVHEQVGSDAIAEQYIDGRELYVSVMGNQQARTFPPFELIFENLPAGAPRIATSRVKWNLRYQARVGVKLIEAGELPNGTAMRLARLSRRVYRNLFLTGYARMDWRLTPEGKLYLLEANPNPDLADGEAFAESAEKAGIGYNTLLQKIVNLGLRYRAQWAE